MGQKMQPFWQPIQKYDKKKGDKMNWLFYSLVAMISFAVMILIFKKLTTLEQRTEVINFYFFLFTTTAFSLFVFFRQVQLQIPIDSLPLLILLAIIAVVANYCSITAIRLAPNPGYVRGIQSFEVVVITVLAVFLFQSDINLTKLIGIALSLCGIILLSV